MRFVLLAALTTVAGCGGGQTYVPVSGRVTLNGKPLPNAAVTFQPHAPAKGVDPGPGSSARTDADGKYVLYSQFDPTRAGAVVGKHTVRIVPAAAPSGVDDADRPHGKKPDGPAIPARYNVATELTYDVIADGSDRADFALTSP